MKFLIFIAAMAMGFVCIRYSKWLKDNLSIRWSLIENTLPGGMYTAYKLLGLIAIILAFYILFGGFGL